MKNEYTRMSARYNYQTMTIKRIVEYEYTDYTVFKKHIETMKQYNYILNDYIKENNKYRVEYMRIESIN